MHMPPLFRIGQILKGRIGSYTITTELQETVWFAKSQALETVVIKSVRDHPRVENEGNVLKRFQHRTPYLRPMIDEIKELPSTVALRYLDSDLLEASIRKTLNRKELMYVSRRILEALKVLHEENYVHTDVKLDNVFVNFRDGGDVRFDDVQLGDLGSCVPADSEWATSGTLVGAPMWTSPEILMEMPWNTAADIWSFGAILINLIYGGDFNIFLPKDKSITREQEEYLVEVVKQQYRFFGPFPASFEEIASPDTINSILRLMQIVPLDQLTPFAWVTEREVSRKDKDFILKIMKLDWRDRPTPKELLEDEWWGDDVE